MNRLPLDMAGNEVDVRGTLTDQRYIAQKSRKVAKHCPLAITAHL